MAFETAYYIKTTLSITLQRPMITNDVPCVARYSLFILLYVSCRVAHVLSHAPFIPE